MKPKATFLALAFILMCGTLPSFSQDSPDVESYTPRDYSLIPPSPEVSALMKYIDFPVSPFTGQPNITLPLYTVREGSLEIPISISYHGGGIKVDELSGIIGMGWNLNAGGCVMRSVRGLPDEMNTGNYGYHGIFYLNAEELELRRTILERNVDNKYNPTFDLKHVLPYKLCSRFNEGKSDMENDIFQFSFCGHSGTFVINQVDKKPVMSTNSPLRFVEYDLPGRGAQYVLKDNLGNRYEFNGDGRAQETTALKYEHLSDVIWNEDSVATAWHLTKITSPQGDVVTFSYKDAGRKIRYNGVVQMLSKFSESKPIDNFRDKFNVQASIVDYKVKLLDEIETKSTKIKFSYTDDNEKLKSISVYRKNAALEPVKKFVLKQERRPVDKDTYELFLQAVAESSIAEEESVDLYRFSYNSCANNDSERMYAQDYWGYYNGAANTTLLSIDGEWADRDADEGLCKNGILEKVEYATGGETSFDWELNDYAYIGGNQDIKNQVDTVQSIKKHRLSGKSSQPITNARQVKEVTYGYTVPEGKDVSISVNLKTYVEALESSGLGEWFDKFYNLELAQAGYDDCPRLVVEFPDNRMPQTFYIDRTTASRPQVIDVSSPGLYRFVLKDPFNFEGIAPSVINGYFGTGAESGGDFGYVEITVVETEHRNKGGHASWGGLRVKSITSSPRDGSAVTKHYRYTDDWDGKVSSGTILEYPHQESNKSMSFICKPFQYSNSGTKITENWITVTTYYSNFLPSSLTGGPHVEYPSVWEWYENDDNSLRIHHLFSSQRELELRDVAHATFLDYIPPSARIYDSFDFLHGDLVKKEYYLGPHIYKTEDYDRQCNYTSDAIKLSGPFHRLVDKEPYMTSTEDNTDIYSSDYTTCIYGLYPYNKWLASLRTTERTLAPGVGECDNASFCTEDRWAYFSSDPGSQVSKLLKSETHVESDGAETVTYYTYCRDTSGSPINLRETEVAVRNGKIVSARRNEYDSRNRLVATYRGETGVSAAGELGLGKDFQAGERLKSAINIPEYSYRYDNDNNLVQISYNGIALASYLWSYLGSHPVAEIKNVPYDSLCAILPTDLKPAAIAGRTDLKESDLDRIRAALPEYEVSTITYDWLIGAGTVTDAAGMTTRFSYDGYGRLASERDVNGYYIKKYEYHYKNQ